MDLFVCFILFFHGKRNISAFIVILSAPRLLFGAFFYCIATIMDEGKGGQYEWN